MEKKKVKIWLGMWVCVWEVRFVNGNLRIIRVYVFGGCGIDELF